ncbi:PREDICTED: probable carbohydrate esterase At4g34215 [Tarenaya hassleriana]|uniref:probable carbohydrate esterase At4g34215 n=1 Tax=Tarenaya hassleriana TaxID=28532 RepID=UPI00053C8BFC|nr:PREDICTED: probable carbohydrate esterase At4g34215 [Tarenaya hassleriana]
MIFLFFVLLLLLHHPIHSQNVPGNVSIFILAGQSNMAGRGGIFNGTAAWDGVVPPESRPSPRILRLTAKLTWEMAQEPLHADIDVTKTNGIGPGMPFANRILDSDPRLGPVGLVPCAIGGTSISQWQKGESLYEETVRRAAMATATANGGSYKAVLWYQGESDTVDPEESELYKQRLIKFFTDLRSDLRDPNLPIIQVALASGEGPYLEAVREAQLETDLKNVHCVDAKGLRLEPDGLHLTTSAQVRLGGMMADAFLAIPNATGPSTPNSLSPLCLSFLFPLLFTLFTTPSSLTS